MARKSLSKKVRFEVFKRDSFTCQYCGQSAPTIILNIDHVIPVASGGDNSILNLVTSCFDCNSGKGKRELSDNAVVTKQIDQLKLTNERKAQIEMIAQWRKDLASIENLSLDAIKNAINIHLHTVKKEVNDNYLRTELKVTLSKYGFDEVLQSIEKSANQYLIDPNCVADREKFLTMIPRICYWAKHERENPEIAKIRKLAYTANKRWWKCNPQELTKRLIWLNRHENWSTDDLYLGIISSTGIMQFEDYINGN